MALTKRERKWWSGFLKGFSEKGYDINNPADRACLLSMCMVGDRNAPYFTRYDDYDANPAYMLEIYHTAETVFSSIPPIDERYVKNMYKAALSNELYIKDIEAKRKIVQAVEGVERQPEGDFLRVIGVAKDDGGCIFSKSKGEIYAEAVAVGKKQIEATEPGKSDKEKEILLRDLAEDIAMEKFNTIMDSMVKSETVAIIEKSANEGISPNMIQSNFFYAITSHFDNLDYTQGTVFQLGEEFAENGELEFKRILVSNNNIEIKSDAERDELVEEGLEVDTAYRNYQEHTIYDAHQKGFGSKYLETTRGAKTLSNGKGAIPEEHLKSLFEKKDNTTEIERLVGEQYMLFDKNMKPVDMNNPSKAMRELGKSGLFFFKEGSDTPTRIKFNKLTNTLVEDVIPKDAQPIPKPGRIKILFHKFVTRLGGKGLDSCVKYYAEQELKHVKENKPEVTTKPVPKKPEKIQEKKEAAPKKKENTIGSLARAEEKRLQVAFGKLDKVKDKQMYRLTGDTASAWKHIYEKTNSGQPGAKGDFSFFEDPEKTYIARIVLNNLIEREQMTGGNAVRDLLETKGYVELVKSVNETALVKDFKKNITTKSMMDICKDKGQALSEKVFKSHFKELTAPAKTVTLEKAKENSKSIGTPGV